MTVAKHILDSQVFNSNSSEPASEFVTEFMKEVKPLVADFVVSPSQEEVSFILISTPLFFLIPTPLQHFEVLFSLNKEVRINHNLSIGQGSEVFNSDINPDLLGGGMLDGYFWHFTSEDSEPLPSLVAFDSQSLNLAFRNTMQNDWDVADFGSVKTLVAEKLETILRVSNAPNPTLESWKTFLPASRVSDSPKEVLKRPVNPFGNILPNLRKKFWMLARKVIIEVKFPQYLAFFLISFDTQFKKFIINCLTHFKRTNQLLLLLTRRVNSITIYPEFHNGVVI